MSGSTAEKGQIVRQRLRAAALELIPELGWEGVSTRAIARRAGVAPGLIHYHFASVPALLREAAVEHLAEAVRMLDGVDDPLLLVTESLDALEAEPSRRLFLETALAATRDDELRRELTALLGAFREVLGHRLAAGGVEDPRETAGILAALVDGLLLHAPFTAALDAEPIRRVVGRLLGRGAS